MDKIKRLLSESEAGEYLGLKRAKTRAFGEEYKCIKHIGRRVFYDKTVIDEVLDSADMNTHLCEDDEARERRLKKEMERKLKKEKAKALLAK